MILLSCLNRKIASGQNREAPERPLLGSPRRGFPILSWGRSSSPHSQLGGSAFWGSRSLCWRVGQRVPEEASPPAPSGRPGRQGYSQHGLAPQQWGLSTMAARAHLGSGQLWNVGGGEERLQDTHGINYFLTISSVSAS